MCLINNITYSVPYRYPGSQASFTTHPQQLVRKTAFFCTRTRIETTILLYHICKNQNNHFTMETCSLATCANPGCNQPGTNKCGACNKTPYCGPICQTADWAHHKEECPGHLRKVGMANLQKARVFYQERNLVQAFRHADLAATKLKQLIDAPEEYMDEAMSLKFNALNLTGQDKEALECA